MQSKEEGMSKDEALDLALEALELTDNDAVYGLYRDEKRQVLEAITAIKQALAAPVQEPVQEPVGRTDQQIVDQTEKLAVWLLSWCFNRRPETDTPMRESAHPMAQRCWSAACHIQEMLTATDPENSVAELEVDTTPPAAQPAPEQEPVAWAWRISPNADHWQFSDEPHPEATRKRPLVFGDTTPPAAQRQWVGLTPEEVLAIGKELGLKCKLGGNPNIDFDYAEAIEAKLKEKNT
jgi:hypothetical protein